MRQMCEPNGEWKDIANGLCTDQTCVEGECMGVCAPGEKQCSGQQPQVCGPLGQWQALGPACVDTTCNAAECMGVCAPGGRCLGLTPETCDATRQWAHAEKPCPYQCSAGKCVTECTPGDFQCSENIPQVCSTDGRWTNNGPVCDPCVGCDRDTAACKPEPGVVCGVGEVCGNATCVCRKPKFTGARILPVGDYPRSVAATDLNGDGRQDLAVANYFSSMIVLLGNGDGSFAAKVNLPTGFFPYSIAAVDLNGDGKPDLIVTNFDSSTVSMLLNNGNGTFAPKVDFPTGLLPNSVAAADLNGDGKLDLAVANEGSNTVSILPNFCSP